MRYTENMSELLINIVNSFKIYQIKSLVSENSCWRIQNKFQKEEYHKKPRTISLRDGTLGYLGRNGNRLKLLRCESPKSLNSRRRSSKLFTEAIFEFLRINRKSIVENTNKLASKMLTKIKVGSRKKNLITLYKFKYIKFKL